MRHLPSFPQTSEQAQHFEICVWIAVLGQLMKQSSRVYLRWLLWPSWRLCLLEFTDDLKGKNLLQNFWRGETRGQGTCGKYASEPEALLLETCCALLMSANKNKLLIAKNNSDFRTTISMLRDGLQLQPRPQHWSNWDGILRVDTESPSEAGWGSLWCPMHIYRTQMP